MMTLEDRCKEIAQDYMDNFVCEECGSPIIVTVSKYPHSLEFKCTNPDCIYTKICGNKCTARMAKFEGDKL